MTHGVNETSIFSGTFSDTSTHYLPDTTAADTDGYDVRTRDTASVVVINNQDQDASVSLETSAFDDPGMADAGEIVAAKTVAANGGVEILSVPKEVSAAYLRVAVSFATAPSGTNPIEAKYQTDASG